MGSMGMTFTGPVTIESADAGSKTVKIKANTREAGGKSNAYGRRHDLAERQQGHDQRRRERQRQGRLDGRGHDRRRADAA